MTRVVWTHYEATAPEIPQRFSWKGIGAPALRCARECRDGEPREGAAVGAHPRSPGGGPAVCGAPEHGQLRHPPSKERNGKARCATKANLFLDTLLATKRLQRSEYAQLTSMSRVGVTALVKASDSGRAGPEGRLAKPPRGVASRPELHRLCDQLDTIALMVANEQQLKAPRSSSPKPSRRNQKEAPAASVDSLAHVQGAGKSAVARANPSIDSDFPFCELPK